MAETEVVKTETEAVSDLTNSFVVTKYHSAAEIANGALNKVIEMCSPGTDIYEMCKAADQYIENEASKIFNKKGKKVEKGIAFPTCISVNEIACNLSPLKDESFSLSEGDVVKIELGCHVDGFIASVGHTLVSQSQPGTIEGKKADVIKAAHTAIEIVSKKITIGTKSNEITELIQKACAPFHCNPVINSYSHQLKRHVVDDKKIIPNRDIFEDKVEPFEFEAHEVYEINILVSTGEGKLKESTHRTTVYKRAVDTNYTPRTQMTRNFINTVNKQFPLLPFSLTALENLKSLKVGVAGAVQHELLVPYSVMQEKPGEIVAHFKYTILILPNGTKKITGAPFNQINQIKSEYEISDPELIQILTKPAPKKKKSPKIQTETVQDHNNNGS